MQASGTWRRATEKKSKLRATTKTFVKCYQEDRWFSSIEFGNLAQNFSRFFGRVLYLSLSLCFFGLVLLLTFCLSIPRICAFWDFRCVFMRIRRNCNFLFKPLCKLRVLKCTITILDNHQRFLIQSQQLKTITHAYKRDQLTYIVSSAPTWCLSNKT